MSAHYINMAGASPQDDAEEDVILCNTPSPTLPNPNSSEYPNVRSCPRRPFHYAYRTQQQLQSLKIHELLIRIICQLQTGDLKDANLLLPQLRRLLEQSSAKFESSQSRLELGWVFHLKLTTIADAVAVACARPFGAFQPSLANIAQGLKAISGMSPIPSYVLGVFFLTAILRLL